MDIAHLAITACLLLPLSLVFAIFLAGQGVIQKLDPYKEVATLETTSCQQASKDAAGQARIDATANCSGTSGARRMSAKAITCASTWGISGKSWW